MKNTHWDLKAVYWFGAFLDGLMVLVMTIPGLNVKLFSLYLDHPSFQYAMAFGASLMAGWTFLLIWGAKKPLERRFLLLLTTLPVLIGFLCCDLVFIAMKSMEASPWLILMRIALILLFGGAFILAQRRVKGKTS